MGWVEKAFETIDLGDVGLERRAVLPVERLGQKPGVSLPRARGNQAEATAAYRFLGNDEVSWDDVLTAHDRASRARMKERPSALCLQDTTELDVNRPETSGLGMRDITVCIDGMRYMRSRFSRGGLCVVELV